MYRGNAFADNGDSIANLFADQFESVYTAPSSFNASFTYDNTVDIAALSISVAEVTLKLNSLDVNKGPGDDSIPPYFLKNCSPSIFWPLVHF